jgi:hypothetical protein
VKQVVYENDTWKILISIPKEDNDVCVTIDEGCFTIPAQIYSALMTLNQNDRLEMVNAYLYSYIKFRSTAKQTIADRRSEVSKIVMNLLQALN